MRTRRPAPAGARPRVLLALLVLSARAAAATTPVTVPVTLPYALLERALAEHVFATADGRLEVLRDGQACNRLVLARPRVAAQGDGRVRVTLDVEAHGGSPLGTRCLLPFTWHGTLDLVETPFLEAAPLRIGFRVTDSHLAAADRTAARAPTMRRIIRRSSVSRGCAQNASVSAGMAANFSAMALETRSVVVIGKQAGDRARHCRRAARSAGLRLEDWVRAMDA